MELRQKKMLVIDDTAAIRTFLRISLEAQDVKIFEADKGSEGIEICRKEKPDLVVLDLGLPDMDGLNVLNEIKGMFKDYLPLVIILSVRKDQRTIDQAISLGANAYLTKPFIMDDLVEVIREQIRKREQQSAALHSA